ncbi:MAG: hypothetical protein ACFFEN_04045 [Candidatus Thorarchaeota archaeon]
MYCSNCGKSISDEEFQRNGAFCDNCAGTVATPEKPTQVEKTTPVEQKTYQVTPQRPIVEGKPGRYSKKAMIFGVLSIVFLIIGLSIGGYMRNYTMPFIYYYSYSMIFFGSLMVTIMHIVGLVFGVTANKNKKRANMYEHGNPIKTIGGIFGLNGIVFNAISMALASIALTVSLISMISSMIYYPIY